MLSGLQVSGSIDGAVSRAQRESEVIDREVAHLTDRLIQLAEAQGEIFQVLARIRLDNATGGGLIRELSEADLRARELAERRQAELARLDRAVDEANARLADCSAKREAVHQRLEEVARASQAADAAVLAELERDTEFVRQKAAAETATATVGFATRKTELAEQDRNVKGKPYESDRLFTYLWERRYGAADYRADPLTRLLDGWVAKLCGYQGAAANYRMLLEIPKRLAEHAERLRVAAEAETQQLEARVEAALESGESGRHRQALRDVRAELDTLEDQLEAAENEASKLIEARNVVARGEDETTRKALATIESALRSTELHDLRRAALGTPTKDDDAAVRRLEAIEADLNKVKAALENQKQIQLSYRSRMAELEQVRREYRRGGYINDSWDFRSGDMLSVLLGEMLRGAISRDIFWDSMRRHQRPASVDISFGGGGGFSWPSSGGGDFGGGGGFGGGSGGGGGDFHTGGGF
jgi:archaellum component FlaC